MMKSLVLVLSFTSFHAFARLNTHELGFIRSAEIKDGKLVIKVLGDCNPIFGKLEYKNNNRATGRFYYKLLLTQTQMGCVTKDLKEHTVAIDLPKRPVGETIVVEHNHQFIQIKIKAPQADEQLGIVVPMNERTTENTDEVAK